MLRGRIESLGISIESANLKAKLKVVSVGTGIFALETIVITAVRSAERLRILKAIQCSSSPFRAVLGRRRVGRGEGHRFLRTPIQEIVGLPCCLRSA